MEPSPPPADPPLQEAVLHIGLGKCGTTSVQFFLFRNRDRLAELGVLNPVSAGRQRHTELGFFVKTRRELARTIEWQRLGIESLDEWRQRFRRRLRREIVKSGLPRALFTDEDLFSSSEQAVTRMRRLMGRLAAGVRLVAYVRRQDDHMVSRYQQAVKIGETARLDEYAARDWAWKYDYGMQLSRWQRVLQPARVVLRRYEPGRFEGGSLYQDFLGAIGIDACAEDFEQVSARNESIDVESAEFIRLLNIYRVEHEGATPYLIDNRALVRALRESPTGGPTLTLSDDLLDRFMERWSASNRVVAREYLGEDELFHAPRKTRNTTPVQRLDPARLDHYLELLRIPIEQHPPLRRIAEREAARAR